MNFTGNQANPLTGRVQQQQQQQQVHQVPVTTSAVVPQGGNLQKNSNLPSFPGNQQAPNMAQKLCDDNKNQMPPILGHHQIQPSAQNNNNHGMGAIPQQLLNVQHQQNMNRNVNVTHQATFQQPPQHLMMAAQKGGIFQQMQQMAYQNQPFPQGQPASVAQSQQPPLHHTGMPGQQNILQKLQATIPQPIHQIKLSPIQQPPLQQQIKVATNQQLPPVSQQSMQYSPNKPIHPQMKTTAKLASPGSQLQSLQKSPTHSSPVGQPAASQSKHVPSTPPISSAPASAASPQLVSLASPVKTQAPSTHKQSPAPAPTPTVAVPTATPVVPSPAVTTTSQSPPKQVPASSGNEQLTKAVEQLKEATTPIAPPQNKIVPKVSVEEKKTPLELNNKTEKAPAPVASPALAAIAPMKATVSSPSALKSNMRLATVTPARQKKPPATNNKKPPAAPAAVSSPKVPVTKSPRAVEPPKTIEDPKAVETPKPPPANAKKPATVPGPAPAPVAASPKRNLAPSTSSVQSNSSSTSGNTTPKTKRSRVKVQPYQSPTPELALVTKLSTQIANSSNKNGNDDKLTIFYK